MVWVNVEYFMNKYKDIHKYWTDFSFFTFYHGLHLTIVWVAMLNLKDILISSFDFKIQTTKNQIGTFPALLKAGK